MNVCILCKKKSVIELNNFGPQPICSRFLRTPEEKSYKKELIFGQCVFCGIVQIIKPFAVDDLLPVYNWISYNEPEEHLDKLVNKISSMPGVTKYSTILGVSFKDDSTLKRLIDLGFNSVSRLDPKKDLGIYASNPGVESIQASLTVEVAQNISNRCGKFDIVIARHILEHAHDLLMFLKVLKIFVKPDGYIVVEVPDCKKALDIFDCTTLWEEHTVYFTPETFLHSFNYAGLSCKYYENYSYPLENSLIVIAQHDKEVQPFHLPEDILLQERSRADVFFSEFARYRVNLDKYFSKYRKDNIKIAMFGAGHLTCTFINLLKLRTHFEFVLDDNINKQGLYMPGSALPIYSSNRLIEENIKLCLLGLNPQNEDIIIEKNKNFIEKGGQFLSIFPASERALQIYSDI